MFSEKMLVQECVCNSLNRGIEGQCLQSHLGAELQDHGVFDGLGGTDAPGERGVAGNDGPGNLVGINLSRLETFDDYPAGIQFIIGFNFA